MRSLWLAREKNGTLYMYSVKPYRDLCKEGSFGIGDNAVDDIFLASLNSFDELTLDSYVELSSDAYPEVTWENSPVEVTVNLKTKK